MTSVIVYDSIYGNTATVAKAIAPSLESRGTVRLIPVSEAGSLDLTDVDLLVVGSPTRGFRPTPAIAEFVAGLVPPQHAMRGAAFDTRLDPDDVNPAPLRWVVQAGGYAADRISQGMREKGFDMAPDAGFLVGGAEGPLKPDECERAAVWASTLMV